MPCSVCKINAVVSILVCALIAFSRVLIAKSAVINRSVMLAIILLLYMSIIAQFRLPSSDKNIYVKSVHQTLQLIHVFP